MNKKLLAVVISGTVLGIFGYVFLSVDSTNLEIIEEHSLPDVADKTISMGTISSKPSKIIDRTQSIADYLASKLSDEKTQYAGRVIVTKTITDMENVLIDQRLDLYFDSPVISCLVSEKTNAVPFLIRWKEGVEKYHSVFFVKKDSIINGIDEQLIGKIIAFQAPESTSGYLIPKVHLAEKGIPISKNVGSESLQFIFSFSDMTTAYWVSLGKADIGVTSNMDFGDLNDSLKNKLKIIERTFDLPRQLVLHRSNMDSDEVEKIRQILLQMDQNPQGMELLENFKDTKKFTDLPEKEDFCHNLFERIKRTTGG
ncbi:MAG: phosphate/phosphite/phosphonate ABC transporter substrate-binding protein [Nitrosopumilus sp.]|nr:phosphate/phosphite/phosphonate ABC transporter substrate-binding protein [Nitrososphaerota archaeon]